MALQRLLAISEVADMLGVPNESLRRAADKHGMTIVVGRAIRLHPDDVEELIRLCRVPPKEPSFTSEHAKAAPPSGSFETPAKLKSQRLLAIAEKLKKSSRNTSTKEGAQVHRFPQRK